jgi:serine/threonine-protein kinase SRPK3
MHLFFKPRCALSISRHLRRPLSSHRIPESPQEELSPFQQEVRAIDPKILATAMGGMNEPPEEPLLSIFEEGFGYPITAAVGRSLRHYEFVRKVRMHELPCLNAF